MKAALGERPAITLFGTDYPTPDGTCIRDYIHVADLADAHLRALHRAHEGEHLICNLGNGRGFTVREVIDAARRVTGRDIPQAEAERRAGDPATLVAGAQRAKRNSAGARSMWTSTRWSPTLGASRRPFAPKAGNSPPAR